MRQMRELFMNDYENSLQKWFTLIKELKLLTFYKCWINCKYLVYPTCLTFLNKCNPQNLFCNSALNRICYLRSSH